MLTKTQKSKLTAVVTRGSQEDLKVFTEAIETAIDFFLCQDNFKPIVQEQAEAIYFLKWLKKCLTVEEPKKGLDLRNVVIQIPENDPNLWQAFQDSLDKVFQEFFVHGSEHTLSKELSDAGFFLVLLRKSLTLTPFDSFRKFPRPSIN